MTTTYLDDAWIDEELRQYEQLKAQLLASARLLDTATTSVPELTRQLEQLGRREQEMGEALEHLISRLRGDLEGQFQVTLGTLEQRQNGVLGRLDEQAAQGRAEIDAHVQQVVADLGQASQVGSVLALQGEVQTLIGKTENLMSGLIEVDVGRNDAYAGQARVEAS